MKVSIMRGDEVILTANESDVIASQRKRQLNKINSNAMNVRIVYGDESIGVEKATSDESSVAIHVQDAVTIKESISIKPIIDEQNETSVKDVKAEKAIEKSVFAPNLTVEDPVKPIVEPVVTADTVISTNARSNSISIDGKFIPKEGEY